MTRTTVIAALAAGALAVTGCGGDEEPEQPAATQEPTATATTEPAPTPTPTTTPTPTPTPTPAETVACGQVVYTPQSDNGAFDIEATGTECDTARAVAQAAEGQRAAQAFRAEGFRCSGERQGGELPSVAWTCTSGGAEVTFVTS